MVKIELVILFPLTSPSQLRILLYLHLLRPKTVGSSLTLPASSSHPPHQKITLSSAPTFHGSNHTQNRNPAPQTVTPKLNPVPGTLITPDITDTCGFLNTTRATSSSACAHAGSCVWDTVQTEPTACWKWKPFHIIREARAQDLWRQRDPQTQWQIEGRLRALTVHHTGMPN